MTELTTEDELQLIRKNRAPSPALQEGLQSLSDTFKDATTGPTQPEAPVPASLAATQRTPAEIDAELGLPPVQTGLPPMPSEDAGFFDVMGAAWRKGTVNEMYTETLAQRRRALTEEMYEQLPSEARTRIEAVKKRLGRGLYAGWQNVERAVVEEANRVAARSADEAARWARYPLAQVAFGKRVVSDMQAEDDEAEAVLGEPGGGFAEFLGSAGRSMTTPENIALTLIGGGSGGLLRTVASEMVLNGAAEAISLPDEFTAAAALGNEDPDAVTRIATGAALGGAFGGGIYALGKGLAALKSRAEARRASLAETIPPGVDRVDHEAALDTAEAELRGDQTVQERLGYEGGARAEARPEGTLGAILGKDAFDWEKHRSQGGLRDDAISGLDPEFRASLEGLIASAPPEMRDGFSVFSGYRSIERQQELWDASDKSGKMVARPGHSKHNHGQAVDLEWKGQRLDKAPPEVQAWVAANLEKFGLTRPMDYEAWHIEPAGARGGKSTPAIENTPGLNYNEDAVLAAIIGVESSGNATARASTSSAAGLGQILTGTWMELIQKHRPDLMEGRTQTEILALRDDGDLNAAMTKAYMRDNHAFLQERGIEAGPAEIYLAHFMGPGGAAKALKAAPETPISQLMSPKEIKANASVRFNGKSFADFTAYDLRMWSAAKMRRGNPGRAGSDVPNMGDTSRGYTGQGQVAVGDNTRIDVDYEVVDYRSLIRASGDLQPRDRSRINSDEWVASTAARLDPAQLMPAPTADRGTPIVGPDNVIESGNGRSMAIARAYERHPDRAEAYRGAIEAAGYTIPDGVEQPVLIARRKTNLSPDARRQLVIDAQDSGVAQMTPTEVARATARNLQAPILSRLDPSQPLGADANGDFVRAALATLPRSARNAMFNPGGALNALGQRQLKEAIFARAWPDPDILARYTEGAPAELKSLMEALETAAPSWAALKADIEAGLVTPDMDISGYVLDAMRLIGAAREMASKQGMPIAKAVAELIDEVDMLEGAISPLTAALVRKMWRNGRAAPADEVASFLTRYADEARKAGQAGGMFDTPGPREVLRTIDRATFKDLPEDLGPARGFAARATSEAPPETVAQIPGRDFDQGARSPEAEATHAEIETSLRATNTEPFGPVYDGFAGNPERAIAHLLAEKTGEVRDAFAIPGGQIGNASLVYGNDQFGLRHIQLKRPEMLARLPELLRTGRVETDPQGQPRLYIVDDADPANVAVIRLDWDGADRRWLVTAYQDDWGKFARDRKEAYRTDLTDARDPASSEPDKGSASADTAQDAPPAAPAGREMASDDPTATTVAETASAPVKPDPVTDAIAAARNELAEFADIEIDLPDGTSARAGDILDDLDADRVAYEAINTCALNPAGAFLKGATL